MKSHPTRYEAASTIYGPHTLLAYQQQYARIVKVTSLTILDSSLLEYFQGLFSWYVRKLNHGQPTT